MIKLKKKNNLGRTVLFNSENTNLSIETELGVIQEIETAELEEFLISNYGDFQNMEDDLVLRMAIREDITRFYIISINDTPDDFVTHSDPPGFWADDTVTVSGCTTCRNPQCAADFINEASDGGSVSVDISFRPIKTMGIHTGTRICYTRQVTLQLEEL